MSVVLGCLATVVASVFAYSMLRRWRARGGAHHAAWGASMVMFALASAALTAGLALGWNAGIFRVYYLFGAILNVPFLGLGSVYLLWGERAGYISTLVLAAFAVAAVITVGSAPVTNPPSGKQIPTGKEVYAGSAATATPEGCDKTDAAKSRCAPYSKRGPIAVLPRIFAVIGNILGTLMVVGGTLVSAFRFMRRRKTDPAAGRLAAGNILIAGGVLVVASGGTSARFGTTAVLPLTLSVGVSVIYFGFLAATRRPASDGAAEGLPDRAESLPETGEGRAERDAADVGVGPEEPGEKQP